LGMVEGLLTTSNFVRPTISPGMKIVIGQHSEIC
jgi:hypothetical protein